MSIDLIVRNSKGQILLGKRNNKPAQDFWFVPGGRILKDETMADAFNRLIQLELNVNNKTIKDSQLIDVFEHFYEDNFSGDEFSTHYVVIGRSINLDIDLMLLPVDQHNDYKWFDETTLLNDKTVHKHSKWYFLK